MILKEKQAKLEELKTVNESELSDEQKGEIQTLSSEIETETNTQTRYKELSDKDETKLTSEEVDELTQLEEKFVVEGKPEPEDIPKKFAGKYDTVDDLLKGINSSEQEKERILKEHPDIIEALEGKYKDSQRDVTKLVRTTKKSPVVRDASSVPLQGRELHEMTQTEYDTWEKKNKFEAHSWLSNATRKESLKVESRKKVFAKYPQFYAMAQGVVAPDEKWQAFDKIATENPNWIGEMNGAELCMDAMEKELGLIPSPKVIKKPVILKPGFEQGRVGGHSKSSSGVLSEEEFARLTEEEQLTYMEGSIEKKGK